MRQPRIKKDSDSQQSPEIEQIPGMMSSSALSPSSSITHHQQHYLHVPIKIERQCSEPSPHLLSVPRQGPPLVKQHSHPLLPSQLHHQVSNIIKDSSDVTSSLFASQSVNS